ncbi:MAG: PLP-dependent aminotransferase family protein, partial [Chloroflexota bacterium]
IAAGAHIIPVPLDEEGLSVEAGIQRCADARLAYVSPSHQHPLGITMSLTRRLELLEWANHTTAWILEDDYDSEYRYVSRPLAALQSLDREQRVIYMGTFSKVMFPALRLGYLVVPPDLVDAFVSARALVDRHSSMPEQAVLTDFITEGHFARHIRRMRTLYAERQGVLLRESERMLTGLLDVRPAETGMHVIGWLPDGVDDKHASRQAQTYGIEATPLSAYGLEPQPRGGLLLGYAAVNEREIQQGVQQLALALRFG